MKEIARFAALGSNFWGTISFVLYQIPHILPIAIPISCLISSLILIQKMSTSGEITTLRASGIGFRVILMPIIIMGLIASILNFYICSEVTTTAKQVVRTMALEDTSINPLVLLQRQKLLKINESYIDMEIDEDQNRAKNLIFVAPNHSNNHLSLVSADRFYVEKGEFIGENVSLISYLGKDPDHFDTLMIENQSKMSTSAESISNLMKKNRLRLNISSLPMRLVFARGKLLGTNRAILINEALRRLSLGFAALSMTFLGISFAINISRVPKKRGLIIAALFSALLLTCYLFAKGIKMNLLLSGTLFLFPHLLIYITGFRRIRNISRGME